MQATLLTMQSLSTLSSNLMVSTIHSELRSRCKRTYLLNVFVSQATASTPYVWRTHEIMIPNVIKLPSIIIKLPRRAAGEHSA